MSTPSNRLNPQPFDPFRFLQASYLGEKTVVAPPLPQPAIAAADAERKFFCVWAEYGGIPTVKHTMLALAEAEADRLARNNPGKRFYILSSLESVVAPPPTKAVATWRSAIT